ncbi:MAG: MATE family efflux transporter [Cyclobacteriaceae bacterium]|nr:MATE family efflux transporter [Cyclobacteriaceae bacterium]
MKTGFLLGYPIMFSQLGHTLVGVADSIMVGRLGATPLAAASLANVVFHLILTFGIGISYAITPLVASADGEGNKEKIVDALRHGFLINIIAGIILFIIISSGGQLLHFMNQPEEVVMLAIPYLNITALSIIPLMFFQTFREFAEGLSLTRVSMVVVICSNLINIVLNYLLIYGNFGFPELGLNGAGWATFIARVIMALWMAAYIFYGFRTRIYRAGFAIGNYSKKLIYKMLHIGIPAGMQYTFEVSAFGFSAIMMGWLGTSALAAHQIAINLATVSYMTTSGLAIAATIRVGNQLGRQDIPNLRLAAYSLLTLALIFMSAWAILFIAGRHFLPALYVENVEVFAIAAPLLIIAGLFQISDGAQVVCAGALRGLQDVKIPSLMIFVAYWVISLPLGYWFSFKLEYGAIGVWMGLLIGLTITATAMFIRFNVLSKKLLRTSSPAE